MKEEFVEEIKQCRGIKVEAEFGNCKEIPGLENPINVLVASCRNEFAGVIECDNLEWDYKGFPRCTVSEDPDPYGEGNTYPTCKLFKGDFVWKRAKMTVAKKLSKNRNC